ncbi:DUF3592 domain-containing protein [Streptomyces sp. TR06-5]|uniref:DUF3592 domain-containing protein n=1 Tax=unclassified Streptomyces TaxID=2593676 RepID=UPI0039A003FE
MVILLGVLWLVLAAVAVRVAARLLTVLRLVRGGARAEGVCTQRSVERRAGPPGRGHRALFAFRFRTADGTEVVFEDRAGVAGLAEGVPVEVRYDPRAPERRATIAGPGRWGPVYVNGLLLAGLAVFTILPPLLIALAAA